MPNGDSNQPVNDAHMSFGEHLEDLRRRLVHAVAGLIPIIVVAFFFGDRIIALLCAPMLKVLHEHGRDAQLHIFNVTESFTIWMKVSLVAALVFSAPWIFYQMWKFVASGLYTTERRIVLYLVPLSTLMVVAGVLFSYFVMLPVVLEFFEYFAEQFPTHSVDGQDQSILEPVYSITRYMGFVLFLMIGVSAAFQLPVVMLIGSMSGLLDPAWLASGRKYALFGCFAAGAVLTPTDLPSMFILAVPLYMLFEGGLVLMRLTWKPPVAHEDNAVEVEQT